MKLLGNLLYKIISAVLVLVVCLDILQLCSVIILHRDRPEIFGWSQAVVLSGSMEPAFSKGDLLLIHREDEYSVGDIITFLDGDALTTHRIMEVKNHGYVTKGDANNVQDRELIPAGHVVGRVAAVVPGIGNVVLFLKKPLGFLTAVLLAAAFLWGKDIIRLRKQTERRTPK